jgi:hypothetical protein
MDVVEMLAISCGVTDGAGASPGGAAGDSASAAAE